MSNAHEIDRSTATDVLTLPPERAFVVEFSAPGDPMRDDRLSGRVEHVLSGQAARFQSAGELLQFVQGVLRSRKPTRMKARVNGTTADRRRDP